MSSIQVYALGRDRHWLAAMRSSHGETLCVQTITCSGTMEDCLERLPPADPKALVLLDATGLPDVAARVLELRHLGWNYVVVAAADPNWKEAHAVLKGAQGYDYWEKTYDLQEIQARLLLCLEEIGTEIPNAAQGEPFDVPPAQAGAPGVS